MRYCTSVAMPAEQNAPRYLCPGPGRFVPTPNKFSKNVAGDEPLSPENPWPRKEFNKPKENHDAARVPKRLDGGAEGQQMPPPAKAYPPHPRPAARHRAIPPTDQKPVLRAVIVEFSSAPLAATPAASSKNRPDTTSELHASGTKGTSRVKPFRTLKSLSPDEFMDIAADTPAAQIATQCDVKIKSVWAQLSKMVRQKADNENRRVQDVKNDLNVRRVASGVIPAVDRGYGVYAYQPRVRRSGPALQAPDDAAAADESEDDAADLDMDLEDAYGEDWTDASSPRWPETINDDGDDSILLATKPRSAEEVSVLIEDEEMQTQPQMASAKTLEQDCEDVVIDTSDHEELVGSDLTSAAIGMESAFIKRASYLMQADHHSVDPVAANEAAEIQLPERGLTASVYADQSRKPFS